MKVLAFLFLGIVLSNCTFLKNKNKELIVNGDFSQNDCNKDWCIFTRNDCVKGWLPQPQIEIGFGHLYSDFLKKQRVIELAPNKNSCVKQKFKDFQAGVYQLKFEYGARKDRTFHDCQFSISFNGKTLKSITPRSYNIQTETIEFTVKDDCKDEQLRFCSTGGVSNSFGAFIKSVSLIKQQSNIKPAPQPQPQPPFNNPLINIPLPSLPPQFLQFQGRNPQGLYIDSHKNQCSQREFRLQAGVYEIIFDYQLVCPVAVRQSHLIFSINGQQIQKVYPSSNGKTIRSVVTINQGSHLLRFCPVGSQNEVWHQIFLSNIRIFRRQCVAQSSGDLIVNGGFESNACKSDWCIWNQHTCKADSVPGWIPSPQIQIGKGSIYNKVLGKGWVAELDSNKNTCIRQNLSLKNGKHILNFDWAGRLGIAAKSNSFEVKINGHVLKNFAPQDCDLNHQKIEFSINSNAAQSFLQFCGTGSSDHFGALIDNVKLFFQDSCGSFTLTEC